MNNPSGSPWGKYAQTGTPLDYVPIDAPVITPPVIDKSDIPDRPSRMVGFAINIAFAIVGLVFGLLF